MIYKNNVHNEDDNNYLLMIYINKKSVLKKELNYLHLFSIIKNSIIF